MKRVNRRSFLALLGSGISALPFVHGADRAAALGRAAALEAPPGLDDDTTAKPAGQWLNTVRIGQITGSVYPIPGAKGEPDPAMFQGDTKWDLLTDVQGWPLLNDTGGWGVRGLDEGANTEHNGKLYFFFGDVATTDQRDCGNPINSDLVAWTDENTVLRHGGHLAMGYTFVLPHDLAEDPQHQTNWRFCDKCSGLFFDGYPTKGVCPLDGQGHHAAGYTFVLPHDVKEDGQNQSSWHFCTKCNGLFFYDPKPANGVIDKGACPKGGAHDDQGYTFVLPHDLAEDAQHQSNWRYCGKCHGLFFDGYPQKGICAASPGGGFHIQAVVKDNPDLRPRPRNGKFDPFSMEGLGQTLTYEMANGAFSYGGKAYVLAGITDRTKQGEPARDGDPALGLYLVSKADPEQPGDYHWEYLFSPRIGKCPRDTDHRDWLESHAPLGYKFLLPFDGADTAGRTPAYSFCLKCASLFWNGDSNKGACFGGGTHSGGGNHFVLSHGVTDDAQNQAKWDRCTKCQTVFFNGYADNGFCPAGGSHSGAGENLLMPHPAGVEDSTHQANWRFCTKCKGMVYAGQGSFFGWVGPIVVNNADHASLPQTQGQGLVVFGYSFNDQAPGVRLAWAPLVGGNAPRLPDFRYYTGQSTATSGGSQTPWSDDEGQAARLFPFDKSHYSHISAAWLAGPKRWIVLYSNAYGDDPKDANCGGSIGARLGTTLSNWSDEITLFDAQREGAWGVYMHKDASDTINKKPPPSEDPTKPPHPGWAYGPFILNRFTEWNESSRELVIYYLLSLSSPYQVQLMSTKLHLD